MMDLFNYPVAYAYRDDTAVKVDFLKIHSDRNLYIGIDNETVQALTQERLTEVSSGLTLLSVDQMALSVMYSRWPTANDPRKYVFCLCATCIYVDQDGHELTVAVLSAGATGTEYATTEQNAIKSLADCIVVDYPGRLQRTLAANA